MGVMRDAKQEQEWKNAQDINVSIDLIPATRQHLKFLAAVDRNSSWLCQDGPALQKAIQRYISCWIPLLAKHTEAPLFEGPLVVPLDCEWVWHCHRLNPVTYKYNCEKLYGNILDNKQVVSTTQGTSQKETEDAWNKLYPNEPFVLDPSVTTNDNNEDKKLEARKFTMYDLASAVNRQSAFFSQVFVPHMSNDIYLEGAVARYKGFLHLAKRNMEMDIHNFLAPTYDIDLIWHTHQLHPVPYCNDLESLLGAVMGHDDTVMDRKRGEKLDVGLTRTVNGWSDMYGSRYRRAGAMHKFSAPSPTSEEKSIGSDEKQNITHLPELKIMEVMLQFVNVKDVPEEHKEKQLFVSFSKIQPDALFMGKRMLTMLSESDESMASFQCQPTGEFQFELVACSPSCKEATHQSQTLGSCSISVEDLLLPKSQFMIEKWMELIPSTNYESTKPISVRMAISVTPPTPAPLTLNLVRLAACLCSKASVCDASKCVSNCVAISKAAAGDFSPCVGNCTMISEASACDASKCVSNCVAISEAGACDASKCVSNCVAISKAGVCDASKCVSNCVAISKVGVCDASKCVSNCVAISEAGACDASKCVSNCVAISKAGVCDASKCVSNCVAISKAGVCDASKCVSNCVAISKVGVCDASKCVSNCVAISKAGASDFSPCVGNCTMIFKANICDASKCVSNCVAISKASAGDFSPCVGNCTMISKANACDASKCVSNCVAISKGSAADFSPCVGNCTMISKASAADASVPCA